MKAVVIKIQNSDVWWALDAAVSLAYASYTIKHFANAIELICNSQTFFRSRDCHKYWLKYFLNGFAGLSYNSFYYILSK